MRAVTVVVSAGIFCFVLPWAVVGLEKLKIEVDRLQFEADRQALANAASTARHIDEVKRILSGIRTQGNAVIKVDADYECCKVTIEYAANQHVQWTDAQFDMESAMHTLLRAFVVTSDDRRNFNIAVFAYERAYGETGMPLVIPLGYIFYDYGADKLSYHR